LFTYSPPRFYIVAFALCAPHCVLHFFVAFVIGRASKFASGKLNIYSTPTIYECQEEERKLQESKETVAGALQSAPASRSC
jgi:hypothetical protein